MSYRNKKIRTVMQRLGCCGGIPGECNGSNTTWAHANEQALGKGTGIKAHDCFVAALCGSLPGRRGCHELVDNKLPRHVAQHVWRLAFEKSWKYAHTFGLVAVPHVHPDTWARLLPGEVWPTEEQTLIALPGVIPDALWLALWQDGQVRVMV